MDLLYIGVARIIKDSLFYKSSLSLSLCFIYTVTLCLLFYLLLKLVQQTNDSVCMLLSVLLNLTRIENIFIHTFGQIENVSCIMIVRV